MNLQQYNKAYVPIVVGVILFGLSTLHVTGQMTVQDALTLLVTSAGVFLIPNKS